MTTWKEENLLRRVKESKKTVAKDLNHLKKLIKLRIENKGLNCSLNDIDVSRVDDMSGLFSYFKNFNGDISEWDVSNVGCMYDMFAGSKFNGDISQWDVSNVDVMAGMFADSKFNGDISEWDVSGVEDICSMFMNSKFNKDISSWDVSNVKYAYDTFKNSPLENKEPDWYLDFDISITQF